MQSHVVDPEGGDVEQVVTTAFREVLRGRLRSLVLFGSRARGDSHPGSDWDFLVIADGLPDRYLDRREYVKGILPKSVRGRASVIAKTPMEFEGHVPELYLDVALDARVLHDTNAYAEARFAHLRNTMKRKGLYRHRSDAGLVWTWVTPPPPGRWSIEWDE